MTRLTFAAATSVAVILIFCLASAARAAVPDSLNYQGYLTDASGAAIEGSTEMMFTIYSDETSGAALWSSAFLVVPIDQGLFSVQLGGVANPFSPTLFGTPLWLGVTVRGEAEMVPRRPLTTVGFSFKAEDAISLQGQGPAAFDQSGHVADMANPHGVTAVQSGGATPADIAGLQTQLDAALATIVQLQFELSNETAERIAADNAEIAARTNADDAEAATRGAADTQLGGELADIQDNTVLTLDGFLARSGDTALFTGVNVQLVNGTGFTDLPTGTGNLIVGYNTADTSDDPICSLGQHNSATACTADGGVWTISHKSGSHNVVIGDQHNYSRFGGLVVGKNNNITGDWSSVSGGTFSTASGHYASTSGGQVNIASGIVSSVSGGESNTASGFGSSISGGISNTASETWSSISGGAVNTASGIRSSVSAGSYNTASGNDASVSGGWDNTASGPGSSVSAGRNNTASGNYASVSGGGSDSSALGNEAYANFSSILGGILNETGNPDDPDRSIGAVSTISGGDTNHAIGAHSSVSGGINNTASGFRASVSGGESNEASGTASSVSGGKSNVASGALTSVVGGDDRTCTTDMCGEGVISPIDP